jgi:ribosomal protein S18 acetylase RimI-like enzyme
VRSASPRDFRPPTGALLVIVEGDETVASGALRRCGDGVGEITRVWTAPAHRRRGHARRILTALEDVARGYGYRCVQLETEDLSPAAIELCASAGYHGVAHDGASARCVCFEKRLD